jgi:cyclin A
MIYFLMQILAMERCMLTVLEFDLMMPTANYFASSYCSILQLSDPIKSLAMYLVDLSLMDGETFLKYLPSVVAGAAVALGRYVFDVCI